MSAGVRMSDIVRVCSVAAVVQLPYRLAAGVDGRCSLHCLLTRIALLQQCKSSCLGAGLLFTGVLAGRAPEVVSPLVPGCESAVSRCQLTSCEQRQCGTPGGYPS
jgi:hypothetical protein